MIAKARLYDTMGLTQKATDQYKAFTVFWVPVGSRSKKYIRGRLTIRTIRLFNKFQKNQVEMSLKISSIMPKGFSMKLQTPIVQLSYLLLLSFFITSCVPDKGENDSEASGCSSCTCRNDRGTNAAPRTIPAANIHG